MKAFKVLAVLFSVCLMSTGCNHDHNGEEHSLKKEKSNQSREKTIDKNHKHQ